MYIYVYVYIYIYTYVYMPVPVRRNAIADNALLSGKEALGSGPHTRPQGWTESRSGSEPFFVWQKRIRLCQPEIRGSKIVDLVSSGKELFNSGPHTSPQSRIKLPFSIPLMCTGARRNLATCSANQGSRKRFAPTLRAGGRPIPSRKITGSLLLLSHRMYSSISFRKSTHSQNCQFIVHYYS